MMSSPRAASCEGFDSTNIFDSVPHTLITVGAFFRTYERDLLAYVDWFQKNGFNFIADFYPLTVAERRDLYSAIRPEIPYSLQLRLERLITTNKESGRLNMMHDMATQTYPVIPAALALNQSRPTTPTKEISEVGTQCTLIAPDSTAPPPPPPPAEPRSSRTVPLLVLPDMRDPTQHLIASDLTLAIDMDDLHEFPSRFARSSSSLDYHDEECEGCPKCTGEVQEEGPCVVHECPQCNMTFARKDSLTVHYRTHSGVRPFNCPDPRCNQKFRSRTALKRHEHIHDDAGRKHPCEFTLCNKTFKTIAGLDKHRKTHTQEKQWRCEICDRSFHRKDNLTVHRATHFDERPFECDICFKRYKQQAGLLTHRRTHADMQNECHICGKEFTLRLSLTKHLAKHAAEVKTPLSI